METTQIATRDIPAQKITQAFERAKQEGRGVLIPYFMCGYPDARQSAEIILASAEGGADIIELGIPFSDPLADGVSIQHAGHVALEQGMTVHGCMEIAAQISAQSDVALLLMGYYNPILAYGIERFCRDAKASGVSGFIVPDLPADEADILQEAAYRHGLALVFLVPPTTPNKRIEQAVERIVQGPGAFLYCISLSGVTGSRETLPPHLREFIERVRSFTRDKHVPLTVGFGLSTPEHIAQVNSYAEGAVVGSALVNLIDRYKDDQPAAHVKDYIHSLAQK
jgi:tryptophan synthase alpha chain